MAARQTGGAFVQPTIDTTKAHPARVYDYFLGGKDHFAVDRETAHKLLEFLPTARTMARENRAFMGRAVRFLAAVAGVRQFLDIGTGLPSANNVHQVAQSVAPESRVVYVDNDPIVLAHARALLTSSEEGKTAYIQADLRDPEAILANSVTQQTLDFNKPIALMLVAVLHFIPDSDAPAPIVSTLLDAFAPGSFLVASHGTADFYSPQTITGGARAYQEGGVVTQGRTIDEFAQLAFRGLDMVDPGLVLVSEWRPESDDLRPLPGEVGMYGGVARKP
jgi:S-adenosyl methyltransferase